MKKSEWFILITLGVISLIFILGLTLSITFRLFAVGVAMVVLSLIYGLKTESFGKQKGKFAMTILIIGVLLILFSSYGTSQSYLSLSDVTVDGGKAYWLMSGIANKIDEGTIFTYNPSETALPDGSTVKPQKSLKIEVSKDKSYCEYQLQSQSFKACGLWTYNYYTLSNAERVAKIKLKDSTTGDTTILDGTILQSKVLSPGLTVETQGIITGKQDCPPGNTVAIIANKDGSPKITSTSYIAEKKSLTTGASCFSLLDSIANYYTSAPSNAQFTGAFEGAPAISSGILKGDKDIGSGLFTFTASQEYFNSVILAPAKPAVPKVANFNIPNIQAGKTGSVRIDIQNSGTPGTINVITTADGYSVFPSSQNTLLNDHVSLYLTLTAKNVPGTGSVTVKTCSTNQFGANTCSSKTGTGTIVSGSSGVSSYCGDGNCDFNENSAVCSADCKASDDGGRIGDTACSWYQEQVPNSLIVKRWYNYIGIGSPKLVTDGSKCVTAGWVNAAIIGFFTLLGVTIIGYMWKPQRPIAPSKKKKRKQ